MRGIMIGLLIFSGLPQGALAQGSTLQRVREEVQGRGETKRDDPEVHRERTGDEESQSLLGEILTVYLLAPFTVPNELLGDKLHQRGTYLLTPYRNGLPGAMVIARQGEVAPDSKSFLLRLSFEASSDFHDLHRVSGRLLLDTSSRLGLSAGWMRLHERGGAGRSDEMGLGDINLLYRFAQSERVQFRSGIGTRFLVDHGSTRFGFNFTYGADYFPARPLVFSSVIDAGTLGSAGVFHGRLTGGITRSGWEIFAGYDYLRIGRAELQGPVLGLRFWF